MKETTTVIKTLRFKFVPESNEDVSELIELLRKMGKDFFTIGEMIPVTNLNEYLEGTRTSVFDWVVKVETEAE